MPEEDKDKIQEAAASLAAAKETSVDAVVVAVLPEQDGIFPAVKAFLGEQHVFTHT